MALTDNLVAFWELEEASGNRVDSVASLTLTDVNTVTSAAGIVGTAAQFTAANNEQLFCADNATVSTGDIDFTLMAWVRFDTTTSGQNIITKAAPREYELRLATDFEFNVSKDSAGGFDGSLASTGFGAPSTATWYQVFAWHDSVGNTINLQIKTAGGSNNATVYSTGYSLGVFDGTSDFNLGTYNGSAGFLNGRLDQVGVWKRVLTSTERDTLFNSASGLSYSAMQTPASSPTDGKIIFAAR